MEEESIEEQIQICEAMFYYYNIEGNSRLYCSEVLCCSEYVYCD